MIQVEEDLARPHPRGSLELLHLRENIRMEAAEKIFVVMFRDKTRVHSAQRLPDVISHFEKWETYLSSDKSFAPSRAVKIARLCPLQFLLILRFHWPNFAKFF